MGVLLNISTYQKIIIAIARQYLGTTTGFEAEDREDKKEMDENEDRCWWTAEDAVIDHRRPHTLY
jgi:hypothetical protein